MPILNFRDERYAEVQDEKTGLTLGWVVETADGRWKIYARDGTPSGIYIGSAPTVVEALRSFSTIDADSGRLGTYRAVVEFAIPYPLLDGVHPDAVIRAVRDPRTQVEVLSLERAQPSWVPIPMRERE
jgi:hypothetical protein